MIAIVVLRADLRVVVQVRFDIAGHYAISLGPRLCPACCMSPAPQLGHALSFRTRPQRCSDHGRVPFRLTNSSRNAIIASNMALRCSFLQRHVCQNFHIAGLVRYHRTWFNSRLCGGFHPEQPSAIMMIGFANRVDRLTPARHMNL